MQTRLRLGLDLPGLQPPDGVTTSRIERRVLDVFIAEAPYRTQALTALAGLAPWDAAAFAWSSVRRRARSRRSDR